MKRHYRNLLLLLGLAALLPASVPGGKISLTISNPSATTFTDYTIRIENETLLNWLSQLNTGNLDVTATSPLSWQLLGETGNFSALLIQADLPAGGKLKINIRPSSQNKSRVRRSYAELSVKEGGNWQDRKYIGGEFKNITELHVPAQLTDHSYYIRYEGPGWESDRVGYRFYLDWRNAVDVYGKCVDTMVLAGVGLDGYDSYHEMSPWGMDILKVGETLGLGTPAWWNGKKAERIAVCDSVYSQILYSGDLESRIKTHYHGWKTAAFTTGISWELSINAGSRLSCSQLDFTEDIKDFCTGIVKMPGTELFTSTEGNWGYMATYGQQSLNGDLLGLVVFFPVDRFSSFTTDGKSEIVVLQPESGMLTYYFGAAWEKEKNGITNKEEFLAYIRMQQELLNNSQQIKISTDR